MNKVILMGRLTKDPELRYTSNNLPVCRFTLAVDRRFSKKGEEKQTDFIQIVAWDKQAEFCSKYFQKGRQVVIVGRIQTGSYEKDGQKHYTTDIVADETYFADSKRNDEGGSSKFLGSQSSEAEGFYPIDDSDNELPF